MSKLTKLLIIVALCIISYYLGWGKGQYDTYQKVKNSPSLLKQEELYK